MLYLNHIFQIAKELDNMANTSNGICVICDHEFKQNEIALSLKIIGSPQDVNGNCRQICMQCVNNLRDLALYNLASDFFLNC